MFEQFSAKVSYYYKGVVIQTGTAECIINAIGIQVNDRTIPMSNIIFYDKFKNESESKYKYDLTIHVVNWVK